MTEANELIGVAIEAWQPSGAAVGVAEDGALAAKRVLVPPRDPCGQCDVCRRGGAAVCPSARARELGARVHASPRWLVALGDGLDLPGPTAAAVAGDVALAYTLYARTGLAAREPVVVLGATSIARFLVEILRAKSVAPTVVAPRDAAWCEWLTARGAAVVRDDEPAIDAAVAAAIASHGLGGVRARRVIATDAPSLALAAALATPRATLTAFADGANAELPATLLAREVTIVGVAGAHPDLIVEAAALCARGDVDLAGGVELVAPGERARDRTRAVVVTARAGR